MPDPIRAREWSFEDIEDAVQITFKDSQGVETKVAIHQMQFANFERRLMDVSVRLRQRPRAKTLPTEWAAMRTASPPPAT